MLETGKERILVIAPHADDEVLGCGGLIEKSCRYRNKVKVVVAAIGNIPFIHRNNELVRAETRESELRDALNYLACDDYEILFREEESFLDTIPQNKIVSKLDKILFDFKPTIVMIPYPSYHQDHRELFYACIAALRPKAEERYKLVAMYEYPLIAWQYPKIQDAGELYLDISETIDKKIEALKKHQSQLRTEKQMISPEKVKDWASKRGLEIGVNYAEKYYFIQGQLL